jgi:thymidylate synthase (FAD)
MIKVTLVSYTPNPLYVCAEAAAVCYDSEPDLKIVKGCIRSGHQSVLEHCSFTFKVEGISRACSHQLVRHRIASYSQQSQRYVTYNNLEWATTGVPAETVDELEEYCDYALTAYMDMIERGVKAEDAREVLPNATPTIVYVTFNLRALMHFCNERMCTRAQKEIREVASLMKEQVMWAENISVEEKTILSEVLVPKCEAGQLKACPESAKDCCGRHKPIKEFVWRPKAVWQSRDTFLWYCSACGSGVDGNFAFCPCCGAEMTGCEKND